MQQRGSRTSRAETGRLPALLAPAAAFGRELPPLCLTSAREIEGVFPTKRGKRGFEGQRKSYVESHPTHRLSGALNAARAAAPSLW